MNSKNLILLLGLLLFSQYFFMGCKRWNEYIREQGWAMHHIDNQLYNHNSLSPGDVNQDGMDDYAVIHEGPNVYSIVFHPGKEGDIRSQWNKIVIGRGTNIEYAYLGDMDGDGNLDLVGVEGSGSDGKSGVRILWGPDKSGVMDSAAWKDGGLIPGTEDAGHYLYVECHDVNGDGAMDIVTGGRVLRANGSIGGLKWIEGPKDKKDRRNLSKWQIHYIDPNLLSGHGFVFTDIDQDGDNDFVIANADWDTPDSKETVIWYENPGLGVTAQNKPWQKHNIFDKEYGLKEFFAKPQVAVGDLNGDGLTDIAVQTFNRIYYFRKKNNHPVEWEQTTIMKPEITRWVNRPIKFADINHDGQLDIVGMLIHNFGYLPKEKASVFWMEFTGNEPDAENWVTHVIKWADGSDNVKPSQGEKWDHCRFLDMDGDGDVDIIGNCEEHYLIENERRNTLIGVVWFENPLY